MVSVRLSPWQFRWSGVVVDFLVCGLLFLFQLVLSSPVQAGCIWNVAAGRTICAPVPPPFPFVPPFTSTDYNTQSHAQEPETGQPPVCVGNPCNPLTGNKFQVETDGEHSRYGRFLRRYYNSDLASVDAGLGKGWSALFLRRLEMESSTQILIHRGDGSTDRWRYVNGRWQGNRDTPFFRLRYFSTDNEYGLELLDGSYEVYDGAGRLQSEWIKGQTTRFLYNDAGKLAQIVGHFGHTVTLSYNTAGQLTRLALPDGQAYRYAYQSGRLRSVTYPNGFRKTYHYEDARFPSHLTGMTDGAGNRYANFAYNNAGKAIRTGHATTRNSSPQEDFHIQYVSNSRSDVTDALNNTVEYHYQTVLGHKRLIRMIESDNLQWQYAYDSRNNLSQRTNPNGNRTTFAYNDRNLLTRITAVGTSEAHMIEIDYLRDYSALPYDVNFPSVHVDQKSNIHHNLLQPSSYGNRATFAYNDRNLLTRATAIDNSEVHTIEVDYLRDYLALPDDMDFPSVRTGKKANIQIRYTSHHLPFEIRQSGYQPDGTAVSREWDFRYNNSGQVTEIGGPVNASGRGDYWGFEYYDCTSGGRCGQLAKLFDYQGRETHFRQYDAQGRVTQIEDRYGDFIEYSYSPRGYLASVSHRHRNNAVATRTTRYRYTPFGELASIEYPGEITLSFEYNAAQELTRVSDNLNNAVHYTYGARGNRQQVDIKQGDALQQRIELAYDVRNNLSQINRANAITQLVSDGLGQLVTQTDPKQNPAQQFQYNALEQLTRVVDSLGGATNLSYDPAGRIAQIRAPNGANTQYVYDDLGNVLEELSSDRGRVRYEYDSAGNITQQQDARGVVVKYEYDQHNRLVLADYAGTAEDVRYEYDSCDYGIDRLCEVRTPENVIRYQYTMFGEVASETHEVVDDSDQRDTVRYDYAATGHLSRITYPSGRQVRYDRDAVGRVVQMDSQYYAQGWQEFTVYDEGRYRADSRWSSRRLGNGVQAQRTYNARGLLSRESHDGVQQQGFVYDANDNLTRHQRSVGQRTMSYDGLDRLTVESGGGALNSYGYDANGNVLSRSDGSSVFNLSYVANSNRVADNAVVLDASGNTVRDGNNQYSYDLHNRLASVNTGDVVQAYDYDGLDRRRNKGVNRYVYDVQHRLIAQHNGEYWTDYLFDDQGLVMVVEQTAPSSGGQTNGQGGALVKAEGLDPRVVQALEEAEVVSDMPTDSDDSASMDAEPVARFALNDEKLNVEDQRYWVQTDQLGSPHQLTNADKAVVWRWQGDGYGATTPNEDVDGDGQGVTLNLRYPGQYFDEESGLHYNVFRYYDPSTGRYISSDPIGLAGGLNTFAYVVGNPLKYVDPLGLRTEIIIWQPVTWGKSSFGHVSANINGKNYSWTPSGWDTRYPTASGYADRQKGFRAGVGVLLNLTSDQERSLESCYSKSRGEYSSVSNNCADPHQECLSDVLGYTFLDALFPVNFGNKLINSPYYDGSTFYEGPKRGWFDDAPWAR